MRLTDNGISEIFINISKKNKQHFSCEDTYDNDIIIENVVM